MKGLKEQMTKKYVVKNCPCFVEGIAIKGNEQKTQTCNNHRVRELTHCQDCTDCLIKQIIDRCRDSMDYHSKDMYILGRTNMAGIVLALLQIEEVE